TVGEDLSLADGAGVSGGVHVQASARAGPALARAARAAWITPRARPPASVSQASMADQRRRTLFRSRSPRSAPAAFRTPTAAWLTVAPRPGRTMTPSRTAWAALQKYFL